jgi:hypothetical protein
MAEQSKEIEFENSYPQATKFFSKKIFQKPNEIFYGRKFIHILQYSRYGRTI